MRNLLFLFLLFSMIVSACNNNKKPGDVTVVSEDGEQKTTMNLSDMEKRNEEMQKQAQDLQNLTPVSMDELKAMLPEELMGAKRARMQATTAAGTGMATAQYDVNDSTELRVSIWDCGGPGGAGMFSLQYMTLFNYEADSEDEYTKTIEFDGKRGIEQCSKVEKDCKLTYFGGKRFLVTLEGENIGIDELKQVSKQIAN